MGWRQQRIIDQWPGRGPFSYLPPWQRPRWNCGGRGFTRRWSGNPRMCARFPWLPRWWWADPNYANYPSNPVLAQDEIAALEENKKALDEEKANIEREINDVEAQLIDLKSKLEAENNQ